jgi:hypothetical protein
MSPGMSGIAAGNPAAGGANMAQTSQLEPRPTTREGVMCVVENLPYYSVTFVAKRTENALTKRGRLLKL